MSDFARAQLLKFGWTEGKGLGKNENGIVEALKPKLKFDTSGVGHKDTEFEWWTSVYDKALKNIVLENKSNEVAIKVAKENAFNISSTKNGLDVPKKKHSLRYGKFLKTSTLQDGNLIKDNSCESVEEDTIDIENIIKMSDDDLFKACGGRTAHKGARHGLKLNGKLNRIAEQERQLIAAGYLKAKVESSNETETKLKRKKKKKRDMEIEDCTPVPDDIIINGEDDDCAILPAMQCDDHNKPSRKTCRKVKRKIHDLSLQLTKSCMIEDDAVKYQQDVSEEKEVRKKCKYKGKKCKRKHNQDSTDHDINDIKIDNDILIEPSTKKLKKHKNLLKSSTINDIKIDNDILMEPSTKKLKKHKNLLKSSTPIVDEGDQSLNYISNNDQAKPVKSHSKCKKEKNHHKSKDHKFTYCTKTEADRLNRKIKLKKMKSLEKKEEKKYGKLLESFLAVSLETDPTKEIVTNKSKSLRKLHKKIK